ncbi:unnamed protein product, partial [Rotaria magnacalcarata]
AIVASNRAHTPWERAKLLGPLTFTDARVDFQCTALTPSPTVPTSGIFEYN